MAAVTAELSPLVARLNSQRRGPWYSATLRSGTHVIAVRSGVGAARAVRTLTRIVETQHPNRVVQVGFAGGIDPGIGIHTVIRFRWVIDGKGNAFELTEGIPRLCGDENRPRDELSLLTCDRIVDSVFLKRQLFERYGAAAVDMESFHGAQAAVQCQVPFSVIRTISDPANVPVPDFFFDLLGQNGQPSLWLALRHLARRPDHVTTFWRWRRVVRRGGQALAQGVAEYLGVP